jgi:hypothetical protein
MERQCTSWLALSLVLAAPFFRSHGDMAGAARRGRALARHCMAKSSARKPEAPILYPNPLHDIPSDT